MIQRIQSIYLFLVLVILSLMFFIPIAKFGSTVDSSIYLLDIFGLKLVGDDLKLISRVWPSFGLLTIALMLTVTTIFLYKKRKTQIQLSYLNGFVLLILSGLNYYYIHTLSKKMSISPEYGFSLIFPILSMVLIYLAIRGIKKDDELVKSLDRLR